MYEVWRQHRVFGNVVAFGLVGLFLVLMLANMNRTNDVVTAIRETQRSNTQIGKTNTETLHTIKDCTQPIGRCFKQGQRRTAAYLGQIDQRAIARAACAIALSRQPQVSTTQRLYRQISECVGQTLDALSKH